MVAQILRDLLLNDAWVGPTCVHGRTGKAGGGRRQLVRDVGSHFLRIAAKLAKRVVPLCARLAAKHLVSIHVRTSTPLDVGRSFGYKYLSVSIAPCTLIQKLLHPFLSFEIGCTAAIRRPFQNANGAVACPASTWRQAENSPVHHKNTQNTQNTQQPFQRCYAFMVTDQSCAISPSRYFSTSIAALHPDPAAVIA